MRAVKVELIRDGNAIGAVIGEDLQVGISGWGSTAPEALRDLANAIEREKWPLPELESPRRGLSLVRQTSQKE